MKIFKISSLLSTSLICLCAFSMEIYYIGGQAGVAFSNNFYHQGWNEDTACYSDMEGCKDGHKGYTWLYKISNKWMPKAGLHVGLVFKRIPTGDGSFL